MSVVIQVENLSKKYTIRHEQRERYTTLRDVITNKAKSLGRRVLSPFALRSSLSANAAREEFWALKDVSFEVNQGDRIGIIGRNGAGKTTLLKILSRITEPTNGRIKIQGRVASLLEVGTGFHPELTGRENIFLNGAILGMSKNEIKKKFDEIVDFAEIEKFLDTPVKRYSSGMYVRLAFAVAAHLEPEILLVDEVLAVGDSQFQKKCLGKMEDVSKKEGRTVLFVSHNMSAIQHLCPAALLLSKGQILFSGPSIETVSVYENNILEATKGDHPPHIIFDIKSNEETVADFEVTRIEMLDKDGFAKGTICTWDTVKFRISFWSKRKVNSGSVVFEITTKYGTPLILCSTEPDSTVPMTFQEGLNVVECDFSFFPLSAGEYIVNAGLAIPYKEWLCRRDRLGILRVHPKDVFHSGLAPTEHRYLIAVPHTWRIAHPSD